MDLPSKHVLYFAKRIGARGAGSDGEAAAASYVLRSFKGSDLEVEMETFSSWKSDLHALLILYLLTVGAFGLYRLTYAVGLAVAILVFLVFQMETYTWAVVSRLLPRSSASNVIGRVRPKSSVRQKVVLVANYDSARSSPLGGRRASRLFRLIYIISFASMIAVMLVGFFGVGASLTKISANTVSLVWLFTSPFAAYLAILSIVIALNPLTRAAMASLFLTLHLPLPRSIPLAPPAASMAMRLRRQEQRKPNMAPSRVRILVSPAPQ